MTDPSTPQPSPSPPSGKRRLPATVVLGALLLGLVAPLALPRPAGAAIPVIDPANLAQNIRTAIATVQAISQRIQMIRNQIREIEWMVRNVQQLDRPTIREVATLLAQLEATMRQETRGLVYSLRDLSRLFEESYPGYEASPDVNRAEAERATTTLDTFRAALLATQQMADANLRSQLTLDRMKSDALDTQGLLQASQSQALLTSYVGEEISKLLEQVEVLTNVEAVGLAHRLSSEATAEATFTDAVRRSRRGVPSYDAVQPLPLVPTDYPHGVLGGQR